MTKAELAERMLASGCTRDQVEFTLKLEVCFFDVNNSRCRKIGLKIPGHSFVYKTFYVPVRLLAN